MTGPAMRICTILKPALAALIAWCCLPSGVANASSLEISPVSVNLVAGQSTRVIEIRNRGGSSVAIQIRAYAWSQSGNTDVLVPTRDIILSPPIFTIPAGASQTIRLLLRGPGGTGERSYRLLLDEVLSPDAQRSQVGIALRISLPVITAAASPPSRSLRWRARRGPGNQILVSAANTGNVYDKVHAIAVTLPDGSHPAIASSGDNPYLLTNAQREWVVQGATPAPTLRLNVTTQAGISEHVLVIDS
ncbi:MAG: fimbrial chaperone protein [Sphingomonadales bacterium]|jgi:fimbrial chaperone protein|nr:fimbrial chaperone protein [Sphingomonadales bacterium]